MKESYISIFAHYLLYSLFARYEWGSGGTTLQEIAKRSQELPVWREQINHIEDIPRTEDGTSLFKPYKEWSNRQFGNGELWNEEFDHDRWLTLQKSVVESLSFEEALEKARQFITENP
jgi:hypothetical protein